VPLCVVSAAGKMLDGLEAEAARLAGSGWLSLSLSRRETGGHYSQLSGTVRQQRAATAVRGLDSVQCC
jgi:hypothetical protein